MQVSYSNLAELSYDIVSSVTDFPLFYAIIPDEEYFPALAFEILGFTFDRALGELQTTINYNLGLIGISSDIQSLLLMIEHQVVNKYVVTMVMI